MSSYTEKIHVFSSHGKVGTWKSTNYTPLVHYEVSNFGLDPQEGCI